MGSIFIYISINISQLKSVTVYYFDLFNLFCLTYLTFFIASEHLHNLDNLQRNLRNIAIASAEQHFKRTQARQQRKKKFNAINYPSSRFFDDPRSHLPATTNKNFISPPSHFQQYSINLSTPTPEFSKQQFQPQS